MDKKYGIYICKGGGIGLCTVNSESEPDGRIGSLSYSNGLGNVVYILGQPVLPGRLVSSPFTEHVERRTSGGRGWTRFT